VRDGPEAAGMHEGAAIGVPPTWRWLGRALFWILLVTFVHSVLSLRAFMPDVPTFAMDGALPLYVLWLAFDDARYGRVASIAFRGLRVLLIACTIGGLVSGALCAFVGPLPHDLSPVTFRVLYLTLTLMLGLAQALRPRPRRSARKSPGTWAQAFGDG